MTHAEDYRRRPGFHGWRHASARRVDRGSDQGLQGSAAVMPYFDQEFGEEIDRVSGEIRPPARPQDLEERFAARC